MSKEKFKYTLPLCCKICGHPSHCGTPLWREEKDYDGREYQIQVCHGCSCKTCRESKE